MCETEVSALRERAVKAEAILVPLRELLREAEADRDDARLEIEATRVLLEAAEAKVAALKLSLARCDGFIELIQQALGWTAETSDGETTFGYIRQMVADNAALRHDIERHVAIAAEYVRDAERLDWFTKRADEGYCPALLFDDNGHWAVSEDGTQTCPDGDPPQDTLTAFNVRADEWHDTPRDAIDAARNEKEAGNG